MKFIIYGTFCFCLVVGFGCAITDYDIITDNDQGSGSDPAQGIVNTSGKAKIVPSVQVATMFSDGTDETFSMIDQKADGTATITTYNNYSTGDGAVFHDDLYCNPDWNGCSILTAPDNNDGNLFDGMRNMNKVHCNTEGSDTRSMVKSTDSSCPGLAHNGHAGPTS